MGGHKDAIRLKAPDETKESAVHCARIFVMLDWTAMLWDATGAVMLQDVKGVLQMMRFNPPFTRPSPNC
jgi:hypothetical protein